ncbi:MAG: hypothetical protein U1A78_28895 [Polyangia bacterium]
MRLSGWLLALLVGAVACSPAVPPAPASDPTVRGIALGLFASDPAFDYGGLVREIAGQGATDVLLVVPWLQSDLGSDDLEPFAGDLRGSLRAARALGLRAAVMPLVQLKHARPGQWRGQLLPRAGAARWFVRYRELVRELARTAAEGGALRLGIGSELSTLEPYEAEWRQVAREARQGAAGARLFYSLNWDAPLPPFVDELDELGVAAYFALAPAGVRPRHQALVAAWQAPREELRSLHAALRGRPLFFSELGYPALASAAARPWDDRTDAAADLELQQDLYEAFCEAMGGAGAIRGFYAWNWFGFGGPTDRGYTPRGKPAASSLRACLRGFR